MYLISVGSWSNPGEASSWVLLVMSIRVHLVWSVENSHQWYSPNPGLWIAKLRRLALDCLILTARDLFAALFGRTT